MKSDTMPVRAATFTILASVFAIGFATLAARLKVEQVDRVAEHRGRLESQSSRIVQTAGLRGRILARDGTVLAGNRRSLVIAIRPESFRTTLKDVPAILEAVARLRPLVGRDPSITERSVERHLKYEIACPMPVWTDLADEELARFEEHYDEHPEFDCVSEAERVYPLGAFAAHLIGRVGREFATAVNGNRTVNYAEKELVGREGLERQYDLYLRGKPGEEHVIVDATGRVKERLDAADGVAAVNGPDLRLTLDVGLQRAAEAALSGWCGAFAAIDPRDGSVRALASAPSYNLNDCVPVLREETYAALTNAPGNPLLFRAVAGQYAPGSTFKPITALAGLGAGWRPDEKYTCEGVYRMGQSFRLRCTSWSHGSIDVVEALKFSCNPFFCNLGMQSGTGAVVRAARAFGLGSRTGIDYPVDAAGIVPDGEWKKRTQGESWYPGNLAQMSVGQGFLLVTPLQMARVAAAIGSGRLAMPRINSGVPPETIALPFPKAHLDLVRKGMEEVVYGSGGTGSRAGTGVAAHVIGKTGTAQVGSRELGNRRLVVWFIAYATPVETSKYREPLALAMTFTHRRTPGGGYETLRGEHDGGGTLVAPLVAEILRKVYGEVPK